MKTRTILILLISAVVALTLGAWVYYSMKVSFEPVGFMQYLIAFVLVAFALMIGIRRMRSERKGEPAEDELSKRIMQRAASTAYYVSLYWWLALIFISDNIPMEISSLMGTGILGMAVIFAFCWFYYKIRGIKT